MTDNKVLISPDKYSELMIGDEYEIIVKGLVKSIIPMNSMTNIKEITLQVVPDHVNYLTKIYTNQIIKSIHKILPKATPLVLGEIISDSFNKGKIIAFEQSPIRWVWFQDLHNTKIYTHNMQYDTLSIIRESGIPIDWDATFKS